MRPGPRRLVLAVLWIGVGAMIAGLVGFSLGSSSRAVLPFVIGLPATVLMLVAYGIGWAGAAGATRIGGGATNEPRAATAPAAGRRLLGPVIVTICVVIGFAGSMLLVWGGPQRAWIVVSEIPQRISGQVHGLWDSAMLEHDLDALSERLEGRDLEHLLILDDFISIRAYSETHAEGIDQYALRDGSLELSWNSTTSGERREFGMDDVDAGAIRSAVAQVHADEPNAQIRSVSVGRSQGGVLIEVGITGVYEDAKRVFDAKTGEEIVEE